MVQRSGGTCFWPPLLVWANPRYWLTRRIQHRLQVGAFPSSSSLGYAVARDVQVAARDLLANRLCSHYDLDLSELCDRLRTEAGLEPVSMEFFVSNIEKDPTSPAHPALPLFQGKEHIGAQDRRCWT